MNRSLLCPLADRRHASCFSSHCIAVVGSEVAQRTADASRRVRGTGPIGRRCAPDCAAAVNQTARACVATTYMSAPDGPPNPSLACTTSLSDRTISPFRWITCLSHLRSDLPGGSVQPGDRQGGAKQHSKDLQPC